MSTGSSWILDQPTLTSSLERFRGTRPTDQTLNAVHEWLMDCVTNPFERGQEDPGQPGVFFARPAGTGVGIPYTVDLEMKRIYIADIS